MNKLKNKIIGIVLIIAIPVFIFGIGYIKYKIWKAEHPHTSAWVFFIPTNK